ncbi:MAG: CocE/NonD family hydrolase, partial [Chloroflexota bacterium]
MRHAINKQLPRFSWAYWRRLVTFFLTLLIIALLSAPALLGILFMGGLLYLPCQAGSTTPADHGLAGRDVLIETPAGQTIQGYFLMGTNGATIIIPPTLSAGRDNRLAEAAMLARHGYSVLIFESRPCAGIGPLTLGYREAGDISVALDYLLEQEGIDPNHIGVYGFSAAGAASLMAAAQRPELKAIVAEGGY